MTDTTDIEDVVLGWPEERRVALLVRLMGSLDGPPDADYEQAWADEIKARLDAIRSGQEKTIPWDEAMRQIMDDHDEAD